MGNLHIVLEETPSAMDGVITAVNSALSSAATSLTGVITTNAPVILAVVGAGVAIAFGIKFVKKLKSAA